MLSRLTLGGPCPSGNHRRRVSEDRCQNSYERVIGKVGADTS